MRSVLLLALVLTPLAAQARRPVTLKIPAYEVDAVTDREVCTFVPVPANLPFDIGGWIVNNKGVDRESTSHHFILYAYTGTDVPSVAQYEGRVIDDNACIGMAPNPADLQFLGGAQTPRYRQIMPKGLALRVEPSGELRGKRVIGFVLNSHWINSSSGKRKAKPSIKLIPAKARQVKKYLKPVFEVVANGFMKVPPGEVGSVGFDWGPGLPDFGANLGGVPNPSGPACLTMLTGHMHRRGTLFEAFHRRGDGSRELVYSTEKYDDPGQTDFSPPRLIVPGETIRYECTQDNQTDPRMGCEEVAGETPGKSIVEVVQQGSFDGTAKLCRSDADCAGFGTGKCVPANLVFGFLSEDDMCILPGYYYDADPVLGCDLQ